MFRRGGASLLAVALMCAATPTARAGPLRVSEPGSDSDSADPTVFDVPIDVSSVSVQFDAELSGGVEGPAYIEYLDDRGDVSRVDEIADYDGGDTFSKVIEVQVATCRVAEYTADDAETHVANDNPFHRDVGDHYYDCLYLGLPLIPDQNGHTRESFRVRLVQGYTTADGREHNTRLATGTLILERQGPDLVHRDAGLGSLERTRHSTTTSPRYDAPRSTYPPRRDAPARNEDPDALRRAGVGLVLAGGAGVLAGAAVAIHASTYRSRGQQQVDDAWPQGVPDAQQDGVDDYLREVDSKRGEGMAIGLSLVGVGAVLTIAGAVFVGRARKISGHAQGTRWGAPGGSIATLRF